MIDGESELENLRLQSRALAEGWASERRRADASEKRTLELLNANNALINAKRMAIIGAEGSASMMMQMQRECLNLRKALFVCATTFKRYGHVHENKGTQDGDLKAAVNYDMAAMCHKAIDGEPIGDVYV